MCRRMEAKGVTPIPPATKTATSAEKTSSAGASNEMEDHGQFLAPLMEDMGEDDVPPKGPSTFNLGMTFPNAPLSISRNSPLPASTPPPPSFPRSSSPSKRWFFSRAFDAVRVSSAASVEGAPSTSPSAFVKSPTCRMWTEMYGSCGQKKCLSSEQRVSKEEEEKGMNLGSGRDGELATQIGFSERTPGP